MGIDETEASLTREVKGRQGVSVIHAYGFNQRAGVSILTRGHAVVYVAEH